MEMSANGRGLAATKGPSGWPAQCHLPESSYGHRSGDRSWPFGSRGMTPAMSCSSAMVPDGAFGQRTWRRHCSGSPPQNWRLSRSKMNSALTCSSIVRMDREFESSTNVRVGHRSKSGAL